MAISRAADKRYHSTPRHPEEGPVSHCEERERRGNLLWDARQSKSTPRHPEEDREV